MIILHRISHFAEIPHNPKETHTNFTLRLNGNFILSCLARTFGRNLCALPFKRASRNNLKLFQTTWHVEKWNQKGMQPSEDSTSRGQKTILKGTPNDSHSPQQYIILRKTFHFPDTYATMRQEKLASS